MLFDEAQLASPTTPSRAVPTKRIRRRADFEAWVASQPRVSNPVPGHDHALFMIWAGQVLRAGEDIEWELPPLAVYVPPESADEEAPSPAHEATESIAAAEPLELVAYTDGSGTVAERPCGAGVCVYRGAEVILEASRHLGLGTNNHAELSAIRVALAITDAPELRELELVIRSDSEYAIGAVTRASETEAHRPNARLISLVRRAMRGRRVRVEWVRGHSGVEGNERADKLAGLARLRSPRPAQEPS